MNYQTLYLLPILNDVKIKICPQINRERIFRGGLSLSSDQAKCRAGEEAARRKDQLQISRLKSIRNVIPRRSCPRPYRADRHQGEAEETQSLGEVEEVPRLREAEEQGSRTAAAVERRHIAGSTGSRRRSSGIHRRQRKGQHHHSIGQSGRHSLL